MTNHEFFFQKKKRNYFFLFCHRLKFASNPSGKRLRCHVSGQRRRPTNKTGGGVLDWQHVVSRNQSQVLTHTDLTSPKKSSNTTAWLPRLPRHGAPALSVFSSSTVVFFFSGQPPPRHSHPPPLPSSVLILHGFSSRCQPSRGPRRLCLRRRGPGTGGSYPWGRWSCSSSSSSLSSSFVRCLFDLFFDFFVWELYWLITVLTSWGGWWACLFCLLPVFDSAFVLSFCLSIWGFFGGKKFGVCARFGYNFSFHDKVCVFGPDWLATLYFTSSYSFGIWFLTFLFLVHD